uniref:Uncharacterized protein n=1 Tax=Glossina pallidipes TaxID=7398 RepID=A0A1A9ZV78_GLOPL
MDNDIFIYMEMNATIIALFNSKISCMLLSTFLLDEKRQVLVIRNICEIHYFCKHIPMFMVLTFLKAGCKIVPGGSKKVKVEAVVSASLGIVRPAVATAGVAVVKPVTAAILAGVGFIKPLKLAAADDN